MVMLSNEHDYLKQGGHHLVRAAYTIPLSFLIIEEDINKSPPWNN